MVIRFFSCKTKAARLGKEGEMAVEGLETSKVGPRPQANFQRTPELVGERKDQIGVEGKGGR